MSQLGRTALFCLLCGIAGCEDGPSQRPGLALVDGGISLVDGGARGDRPPGPQADLGRAPDASSSDASPSPDVGPALDLGLSSPDTSAGQDYDYAKQITFHSIAATSRPCSPAQYGAFYCDVLTHTQSPYLGADTLTDIHETQHFMAHENDGATAAADKFIYLRAGKGAFFPEPQLKTQGIWSSIKHQGSSYGTYIAGRPGQPIGENIVDEWRAYLTEEIVAIQIAQIKGQTSGVGGMVMGGVQFLYYTAAALHALQTKEPGFLAANPQAVAVFAMLAEETKAWSIDKGVTPKLFDSFSCSAANSVLDALRSGADNAHIRATIRSLYGEQWASRVLGIGP